MLKIRYIFEPRCERLKEELVIHATLTKSCLSDVCDCCCQNYAVHRKNVKCLYFSVDRMLLFWRGLFVAKAWSWGSLRNILSGCALWDTWMLFISCMLVAPHTLTFHRILITWRSRVLIIIYKNINLSKHWDFLTS